MADQSPHIASRKTLVVAGHRIDLATRRIVCGSVTSHLEPKVQKLLVLLADNAGQVVTREDIERDVWEGTVVGYDALTQAIAKLRRAFNDDPRDPQIIETIPKSGYRLLAPVVWDAVEASGADHPASSLGAPYRRRSHAQMPLTWVAVVMLVLALIGLGYLSWERGPNADHALAGSHGVIAPEAHTSIAVLPFDSLGGEGEDSFVADGFSDDLLTDLSKLRGLHVIARHSSFLYRERPVDVRAVGRALEARYLVTGSVRTLGNRLRVNAQLVDTKTGRHVWTQRYDRDRADMFAVQEHIRNAIVASLDIELSEGDQARVWRASTTDPDAYDLFLRGRELHLLFTRKDTIRAIELLELAVDLDPEFAVAWVWLGWVNYAMADFGWTDAPSRYLEEARRCANQALALDPTLGDAHSLLGDMYTYNGDFDHAVPELQLGVELNPNNAKSTALLALALAKIGRSDEALALLGKAWRLNPHPPDWYFLVEGYAYLGAGDHDKGIDALEKCSKRLPDMTSCRATLIAAYMDAGRTEMARNEARQWMAVKPEFTSEHFGSAPRYNGFADPESFFSRRSELLRLAGVPE